MSIKTNKKGKKAIKPMKKDEKKDEKTNIVDAEKSEAKELVATILKESTAFTHSWKGFGEDYKTTITEARKLQTYVEDKREVLLKHREAMLGKLREILPTLKIRLGNKANKYRLSFTIFTNLPEVEGSSLSTVRRLIDRYEEKYGALFPKELEDKSKEDSDLEAGTQNHIDIVYDIFPKKKEELLNLLSSIVTSIEEDRFERLVIQLNASRSKIKGFRLVVKKDESGTPAS